MQKKKVIILGAGISGLSTAWYLSRTGLPLDVVILEKSARSGGWIHTDHTGGFHFEKGPRTFKVDKSPAIMRLIAELGLSDEVIWSEAKAHQRYLLHHGELQRVPSNPLSFLFSPVTKGFVRALLTEWKKPVKMGDETVWEFVLRRFNYDVARMFFDPMVVGIFGGDIRKISIRACFPEFKRLEEQYGSVTKGMFARRKEKKGESKFSSDLPSVPLSAVFSFRSGMEELTQALVNQIPASIRYNCEAKEVECSTDRVIVRTGGEEFSADYLFCALPVKEAEHLFKEHVPEFSKVHSEGMTVINFGYDANVLPVQGFGYLIPSHAREDLLGVIFDSSALASHNRNPQETRLTIMLPDNGRSEEVLVDTAIKGIRRHLGINRMPAAVSFKRAERAIPQYGVGHLEMMEEVIANFRKRLPRCQLVGNYIKGTSVNFCIERAKEAVSTVFESQLLS